MNKAKKLELLKVLRSMYSEQSGEIHDFNLDVQDHFYKASNNKFDAFNYSPEGSSPESITFYGKDFNTFKPTEDSHYDRAGQEVTNRKHGKEIFYFLEVEFLHDWIQKYDGIGITTESTAEFISLVDQEIKRLTISKAIDEAKATQMNNSAPLEFISNKIVVDTDGTVLIQSDEAKKVGSLTYILDFEQGIEGWVVITGLEDDYIDYRAATYEELQQNNIELPKVVVAIGGRVEAGNISLQSEFKLLDELNKTSEANYEVESLDHSIFQDWPSDEEWENVSGLISDPQLGQLMRYKELANLLSLDTDEVSEELLTKLDNALDTARERVQSQNVKSNRKGR